VSVKREKRTGAATRGALDTDGTEPTGARDVAATPEVPAGAISIDMDVALYAVDPLNVVWHGRYFQFFDRERRCARAHTVLVTTDADGRLLWRTPDVIRERLLGPGDAARTK
jgi:hypothetical protein